jgi:hypothetical protein
VIPEFRDTLLVPKITKCGDLLYYNENQTVEISKIQGLQVYMQSS